MDASDFSFEELCRGNISIYLVLPPDKLQTYARWLRLMVSIAIRAVARGGIRTSASGFRRSSCWMSSGRSESLNAVAQAYGLMAGLGMIIWAFAQDLNQLKRDYPEHWETFIGNSQAMTCFGVMDNFTADYISKMLGTQTIEHTNISTSTGTSVAPLTAGSPLWKSQRTSIQTSTSSSTQMMSRPLMQPDEIRSLNHDLCIIMGRFAPIIGRQARLSPAIGDSCIARGPTRIFRAPSRCAGSRSRTDSWRSGSVAGLLAQEGYEVKKKWGGWEVTGAAGTASRAQLCE